MKPTRLELEGFLSYRDRTVIELAGLRAAVILGENGAGKSSIVEAMTWALFGKGRGRGPDDFVNAGADYARVSLEFEHAGAGYRVIRERDRSSKGKSGLILQRGILEGPELNLGGPRIDETQAAIEELLGLDYDRWLATSLVGQGKADAFTKLGPADRKRILFEVLELEEWAGRATEARDRHKEAAGRLSMVKVAIAGLEESLEALPRLQEEQDRAIAARIEAEKAVEEAEEAHRAAERRADEAKTSGVQLTALRREVEARRQDRQALLVERTTNLRRLESSHKAATDAIGRIEAEIAETQDLRDPDAVEAEVENLRRQLAEMRKRREVIKADAEGQLATATARLEEAQRARRDAQDRMDAEDLITEADRPECPVCRQPLDPMVREEVLAKLNDESSQLLARAGELEAAAKALTEQGRRAAMEAANLNLETEELESRIRSEEHDVAILRSRRANVAALEADLGVWRAAQADDERAIEKAKEALIAPMGDPGREVELEEAIAKAEADAAASEALQADLADAVRILTKRRRALNDAVEAFARLHAQTERLAGLAVERSDAIAKASALEAEVEELRLIEAGCGRDGVPALLLEAAIPELEEEANRLLGLLTDGKFSTAFSTVGTTKTAGTRETLDLEVFDGTSRRSLEALSGGERQCVDLAVRIALAELLARRAGRRIETLIVDEAFTELDPAHLRRTVEAFYGLLDRFETVLVITHLSELAEAFPNRLRVTKIDGASHVETEGATA
jgi:DNA repair protein SbcC/Rad50